MPKKPTGKPSRKKVAGTKKIRKTTKKPASKTEGPRIGVFVCQCGSNIASVINVNALTEYAKTLPNVAVARHYTYMCSEPGQSVIQGDVKAHMIDRVVIATCSPRMHEETFRKAVAEAGLNPYLAEIVNLREHVSWPHAHEPEKATEKAKALVRMGVARALLLEPLEKHKVSVEKNVLVVGGGIAGKIGRASCRERV